MKTAKEKAVELVEKYENAIYEKFTYTGDGVEAMMLAKECALINVQELIKDNELNENIVNGGLNKEYWEQVKKEI